MSNVIVTTPRGKFLVGVVCILVAALSFFVGSMFSTKGQGYATTTGMVVDYYMKRDSEGNTLYSEIAEFVVEGRRYEAVSQSATSVPHLVGKKVEVKYNPRNPNEAYIYKKIDDYIGFIVGSIFGLVGVVMVVSSVKEFITGGNENKENKRLVGGK